MGQAGDGGGQQRVPIPLEQLVQDGLLALQIHELVQGDAPLRQRVGRPHGGTGVDLDAIAAAAGEHLGAVGLAGGGDGTGHRQVRQGHRLDQLGVLGAQLLLGAVGPAVGEGVGVGDIGGAAADGDHRGLQHRIHVLAAAGGHGGGGQGEDIIGRGRPLLGDGELIGLHHRRAVLAALLGQGHNLRCALGHCGDQALLGDGRHLGVVGGPGDGLVPLGAVGVDHLRLQLAGFAHREGLRTGGGNGDVGDIVILHGDVAHRQVAAHGGGDGGGALLFRRNGHVPLFMILVREGGHAGVAGFPGDPLVLILAGAGGVEDNALLGRQGELCLIQRHRFVSGQSGHSQTHRQHQSQQEGEGSVQGLFHGIHLI